MSKSKTKIINKAQSPAPLFRSVLAGPASPQRGSTLTQPNTTSGNRQVARIQWEAYQSSPHLATVVDLIANAASNKWHLERKDEQDEVDAEKAVIESFLNAPNPHDTFSSLIQCVVRDLLIHGGCFLEQHFSPVNTSALNDVTKALDWLPNTQAEAIQAVGAIPESGMPTYLAVLPYDQMEVQCDNFGNITGYRQWTVSGQTVDFAPTEVMFIRHPKSRSKISPESPLNPILNSIRLDAEIVQRHLKVLSKDLVFDTLFILDGKTEEEAQAFNETLNLEYTSRGSAGNALVMGGDGITYQNIGTSIKDGEYLKLGETLRDKIAMRYNVPLSVLGDTSGTSSTKSAGSETAYRIFVNQAVMPLAFHVEQMLNRHLLSHFGAIGLEYVLVLDLLDDDDTAEAEKNWDLQLRNASLTVNEVRKLRGQKQIEGGDTPIIYTATGGVSLESVANPPEPQVPTQLQNAAPADPVAITKARRALSDLRKAIA